MSNVIVLIKSCRRFADRRQAQRETWLPQLTVPYRFLIGRSERVPAEIPLTDEPNDFILFDTPDEFHQIAPKLREGLRWALSQDSDYIFVCDDDTYCVPQRLMAALPIGDHYVGWARSDGGYGFPHPYMQGSAYWLSAKAAYLAVRDMMDARHVPDDCSVGAALDGKVPYRNDERYYPGHVCWKIRPTADNDIITTHKALPPDMRRLHKEFLNGKVQSPEHFLEVR